MKAHWIREGVDLSFFCPACGYPHNIVVDGSRGWKFNGDMECPDVSPSICLTAEYGDNRESQICHSFIRNGEWQFLNDCTHNMAGQTVPVPDYPENWK